MSDLLRSPYPWFGGKRAQKDVLWRAFGPDVPNYIEAFFGGGSVLLGRPGGPGKIETINDLDCDVANFWRAITYAPDEVAHSCDWPVNEADMHAEHVALVEALPEHRERMHREKYYFDAMRAGRWVWGLCMWIGSGWCSEPKNGKRPNLDGIGKGINSAQGHRESAHWQQRPKMSGDSEGMGVHAALPQQLPSLRVDAAAAGMGVHRSSLHQKLPHLAVKADGACAGRGIHSAAAIASTQKQQLPDLALGDRALHGGRGVHSREALGNLPSFGNDRGINGVSAPPCCEWFRALQARLRRVRVACGDFERVLGNSVLGKGKNVGGRRPCAVLLDPPYPDDQRTKGIYREDASDVAERARSWAIEHGDDPDLRIALCGYEGTPMPATWREYSWTGRRGFAGEDNDNRERERIFFSPHCLPIETQRSLFGETGT